MTVYRYMAVVTPTTLTTLASVLPSGIGTISIATPPPTMMDVDIQTPDANTRDDLDQFMESLGYTFMAEDPTPLDNGETVVWENGAWTCVNVAVQPANSLMEESTTKSDPTRKVRNSFVSDSASAKHIILYDAVLETTAVNTEFEVSLILDGDSAQPLATMVQRPGGASRQVKFSGHIDPAVYGEGAHTADIEYKKTSGGGSVKIKGAKVTIWRVL
jgi:hypothetical protein